ncbi:hypothetical protein [Nonomuraea sp. B5E05]|uniref:hypothetical protein n=1 Tax=Nonomuraea sp. B5E05 TaxID=3153569 RepID=UPI003261617E
MAFPAETVIVSSRLNRENMADLRYEKQIRSGNMYGDEAMCNAVTRWRLPDVVFDSFAEIDLGHRPVQLWHFGPGDTVVYAPDARVAWTGNLLCHAGVAPHAAPGRARAVHRHLTPDEAGVARAANDRAGSRPLRRRQRGHRCSGFLSGAAA